jgi:alpha-galactosidase
LKPRKNCFGRASVAAGGRRIDLETLKCGLIQTRSDTAVFPGRADWDQSQTYGLSLYVPCHATIGWDADTYSMRSSATSGFMGEWNIIGPNFPMQEIRAGIAEIKENRKYWNGDFYPLTPWTFSSHQWMAYQFHLPETNEGMTLVFRHQSSLQESLSVSLRGLKKDATYHVTFIDDERRPTSRDMGSDELAHLQLSLEKPKSSLLIRYRASA